MLAAQPVRDRDDRVDHAAHAGLDRPVDLADQPAQRVDRGAVVDVVERHQRHAGQDQREHQRAARPPGLARLEAAAPVEAVLDDRAPRRTSGRPGQEVGHGSITPSGPSRAVRSPAPAGAPRTPPRTGPRRARPTVSGSSATCTGIPVSWRSRSSRPRSRAPPPVSTMPRSMMSPASSGGVWSRVTRTASTIACTGSSIAVRTSELVSVTVRGSPETRSRPRISASRSAGPGERRAEGHLDLLGRRLAEQERVLLLHPVRDGPVQLVAGGPDAQEVTMPPRQITATSVVPPPTSTTMLPVALCTGSPAPIAAAIGSSMM